MNIKRNQHKEEIVKKKKPAVRTRPFVVYAKFENLTGHAHMECWYGRTRSMPTAMRAAALEFWRRPSVRWKHYQLAVLSIQPLTEAQFLAHRIKP